MLYAGERDTTVIRSKEVSYTGVKLTKHVEEWRQRSTQSVEKLSKGDLTQRVKKNYAKGSCPSTVSTMFLSQLKWLKLCKLDPFNIPELPHQTPSEERMAAQNVLTVAM